MPPPRRSREGFLAKDSIIRSGAITRSHTPQLLILEAGSQELLYLRAPGFDKTISSKRAGSLSGRPSSKDGQALAFLPSPIRKSISYQPYEGPKLDAQSSTPVYEGALGFDQ